MKTVNVTIEGVAPLLQHRFDDENQGVNKPSKGKKVYDPKVEAEKAAYRDEDGNIYEPSEHVLGALIKAAVAFKYEGKKTYKDVVRAGVYIEPDSIPLMNGGDVYKEWDEIDARGVVVQRSRVIRWRPRFNKWSMTFDITILHDDELGVSVLQDILTYAGKLGIGDYRPRYGRFMVSKFQEN